MLGIGGLEKRRIKSGYIIIWYLNDESNYFAGIVEYTPFVKKLGLITQIRLYQSEKQIELLI